MHTIRRQLFIIRKCKWWELFRNSCLGVVDENKHGRLFVLQVIVVSVNQHCMFAVEGYSLSCDNKLFITGVVMT